MRNTEAALHRPLALRLRADLQAQRVHSAGAGTWIVKDPLTLEHFQFSAEEYALLDWLRQPISLAELQRRFAYTFPPQTISPEAIWDFIGRLHEAGLVSGLASGQGEELLDRQRRERNRRWSLAWASLLAVRFRGVDPDAFLTAIHDRCRWIFSRFMLVPIVLLLGFAWNLFLGHFDEFSARLPALASLFDARNLPWLLLAIGMVKVLHELGHALVCKHFGGEVRELGFMLLVFAPCLYCDVSDAWRLRSKWQRIAVSSAGIAVEILLAAAATIVWWYARPGVVQLVALNIMVICTVNTLLINGNPLLRYDGYYILSDLLEVPNLWQRAREALARYTTNWLFSRRKAPNSEDPLVPRRQRPWLAVYALASKAYLALVFFTVGWGLLKNLHPYHLEGLVYIVGITVVGSALVGPIANISRFVRNPTRRNELRKGRLAFLLSAAFAAIIGVLALPVNYHVRSPVVLMPADAARIAAAAEGTLTSMAPAGRHVQQGDTLGELANADTELELEKLEGERRLRELRVQHLERLRLADSEANNELPTARAALADIARRLDELRADARRRTFVAPVDGVVIPPPSLGATGSTSAGDSTDRLPAWSGSLLDEENLGAFVKPGTLVCLVGDPAALTAVMLVDEVDVKRLESGQKAKLQLDQLPGQIIEVEVVEISRHDVQNAETNARGPKDLESLYAGAVAPGHTGALYEARVKFDARPEALVIGGRGQAKVAAERITIARLLWRYFAQTFRLPV
jgi:putative peptide zinc metalloprotease protein